MKYNKIFTALSLMLFNAILIFPLQTNAGTFNSLTYVVPASGSNTITSCSGTVSDHGGNGNYSNNANGVLTINSGSTGKKIRLDFTSFDLEPLDYLQIFDGPNTSAPLIGQFNSNPGIIGANNVSGSLTIRFISNNSITKAGFSADIKCVSNAGQADLVIASATLNTASVHAASSVGLTASIKNTGDVYAPASALGYYLSSDQTFDSGDIFLNQGLVSGIRNKDAIIFSGPINIPGTTAAGNYYIIIVADNNNQVNEKFETNNNKIIPVTVLASTSTADVSVVRTGTSSELSVFHPGGHLPAFAVIRNNGLASLGNVEIGFYFSSDSIYDSQDRFLYTTSTGTIAAGNESTSSADITIPSNTSGGRNYVIAKADYTNKLAETNENNNAAHFIVNIVTPDLTILNSGLSGFNTDFPSGSFVSSYADVANLGQVNVYSSRVSVYFSNDTVLDVNDMTLLNTEGYNLNQGIMQRVNTDFWLPSIVASGKYYIISKVDSYGLIRETNENNNTDYYPINIAGPIFNLAVTEVFANYYNAELRPGSNLDLIADVRNFGNTQTPVSSVAFYLSNDNILNSQDQLLGSAYLTQISPSSNSIATMNVPVPNVLPGTYYVIAKADPANSIAEPNESDNIRTATIYVNAAVNNVSSRQANEEYRSGAFSNKLSIYPNPSNGEFLLNLGADSKSGEATISIYNASGILIENSTQQVDETGVQLKYELEGLAKGLYSVHVLRNGELSISKLIIE